MDVLNALGLAWKRTAYLLVEKGSWRRWLALGALAGAAASAIISPPVTPADLTYLGLSTGAVVLAGALIVAFILGIGFICAVARFVMLENLVFDRHEVLEPAFRFGKMGSQLFGVNVAIFVLYLAWQRIVSGAPSGLSSLSGGLENIDIMALLGGLGFNFVSTFLFRSVSVFVDELVAPIMYCAQCGPLQAGGRALALFVRSPGAMMSWAIVRFILGIVCGLVTLTLLGAGLLATLTLVGVTVVPALLLMHAEVGGSLFLGLTIIGLVLALGLFLPQLVVMSAPGIMLLKSFSIYCLQGVDPEIEMLPFDGRDTIAAEIRVHPPETAV